MQDRTSLLKGVLALTAIHACFWLSLPHQGSLSPILPTTAAAILFFASLNSKDRYLAALGLGLSLLTVNVFFVPHHPNPVAEALTIGGQSLFVALIFRRINIPLKPADLTMASWLKMLAIVIFIANPLAALVFTLVSAHAPSNDVTSTIREYILRDTLSTITFFTYFLFFTRETIGSIPRHTKFIRETLLVSLATVAASAVALQQMTNPFVIIAIPITLIALYFSMIQTAIVVFAALLFSWLFIAFGVIVPATQIFWLSPDTAILVLSATLLFPLLAGIAMNDVKNRQEKILGLSERLNLATTSNGLGIWEWDILNEKIIWDEQMLFLYGIERAQTPISTQQWCALLDENDSDNLHLALSTALTGTKVTKVDVKITTADSEKKVIRTSVTPVKNHTNDVIRLIGISSDITRSHYADRLLEQKNRIAKLAQSEFAMLFEMAPGPLILVDGKGKIRKANSAIHLLLGYENGALLSLQLDTLLPNYAIEDLASSATQNLNEVIELEEISAIKQNTETLEVEICCQKIEHNDEAFHIISLRDLTEQKRAESQISSARRDAENANQAKSEFIANMSHEIRTPLNATLGTVKLLQNTRLSELQMGYLHMIQSSGESLLGILNDILDISKIEAGRMELSPINFNLEETLNRIGSIMTVNAGDKDLDLVIHIARDVNLNLYGDPLRLQQILINLVSNAIKFTEAGFVSVSVINVSADRGHLVLGFCVKDSGIGITETQQKNLFSAFMQADNSITRRFGGTGLGLLISKRLVEMMGGIITLKSKEGEGSSFSFTASFIEAEGPMPAQPVRQKHSVLIVEPRQNLADSLIEALERLDCSHTRLENIKSAIEELTQTSQKISYDLILVSDREELPNNPILANTLKKLGLRQNIAIIVTAHNNVRETLNEQLKQKYIDGVLIQPTTVSGIGKIITEAIARNNGMDIPSQPESIDQTPYLTGINLLLVEDNIMNQVVAKGLLEQYGAHVEIAGDGEQAVTLMKANPDRYHTILMDMQMPVMDGFTATKHIRNDLGLTLPILAMTAGVMESEKSRCIEVGMADFIAKPINVEDMLNAILRANNKPIIGEVFSSSNVSNDSENQIFNPENLLKYVKGNSQRYNSIIQMIENVVNRGLAPLEQGRTAFSQGNYDEARRAFHTLKGSMGNIGAMFVWASAQKLESALADHNSRDDIIPLFEELESDLTIMLRTARHWLDLNSSHRTQAVSTITDEAFYMELDLLASLLSENNMQAFEVYDGLRQSIYQHMNKGEQESLENAIQTLKFGDALKLLSHTLYKPD